MDVAKSAPESTYYFRMHHPDDPETRFAGAAERALLYVRLRLGAGLRSRHDPLDVLQETFLAAWKVYDRFEDRGPGSFVRWVCRIAERTIAGLAEHDGAAKRTPPGEAEPVSRILDRVRASVTGPATAADREDRHARLAVGIDALPEDERRAVLDRFFLGLTFTEIAAQSGVPETTVRRRVGRATRALGEMLA